MLTRSQIAKASADAQVAFCLDKQPTYEVALAREIETMMLAQIVEHQETNALNNKVIDTQHRAMVNAEKRGVAKGIEESSERIAALEAKLAQRVPVSGQSRFPGYSWTECAVEHVLMVQANPEEWRDGYEVRLLFGGLFLVYTEVSEVIAEG